jgi:hypothetical protein
MVTLTSETQSPEEMAQAFEHFGYKPKVEGDKSEAEKPPVSETQVEPVETKSDKTGEPGGDKTPVETKPETVAAPEPAKDKKQETPQEDKAEPKVDEVTEHKKATDGFKRKLEAKVAELGRTREELEAERGDKSVLRDRIKALETQIEDLKPKDVKPTEPVKPKRPTRAQFEFDDDKYEAAMDAHDTAMDAYNKQVNELAITKALETAAEKSATEEAQRKSDAAYAAFEKRRDAEKNSDAADLADWNDVRDKILAMPGKPLTIFEASDAASAFVAGEADNPAGVIHYFAKDLVETGGEESARVAALNPLAQIKELTKIDDRITAQRKASKKAPEPKAEVKPEPEVKVEPEKPPAPIVKPPVKTLESPLSPLGGGRGAALSGATDWQKLHETDPKRFQQELLASLDKKQRTGA